MIIYVLRRVTVKKAFLLCLTVLLLFVSGAAAETELRGYVKGEGYQYVQFGEYPYEKDGTVQPVLWRILSVEDGRALLLTEEIVDCQQVIFETDEKAIKNYTYRRINTYAESDLYTWMNTVALETLLGDSALANALVEEPGAGKLFVLTDEQFLNAAYGFTNERYGPQKTRQAKPTPYALKQGVYRSHKIDCSAYWANAIKAVDGYKMQLVGYDGHLSWGAYTRTNVGIRPSVRLDLSRLEVVSGTGDKKDPFVFAYVGAAAQEAME